MGYASGTLSLRKGQHMSTDTYLNGWARCRVERIQEHTPLTVAQSDALTDDIVETFTVEPDLSWPEYEARIDNGTSLIWAVYADTLLSGATVHRTVEDFAAATGMTVDLIRAHGITVYNSATG